MGEKMRDILFRGKRIDNGKWAYGSLVKTSSNEYVIVDDWDYGLVFERFIHGVIPETVGQFTGVHDDSVMIFDGDIVKSTALGNDHNQLGATVKSEIVIWQGNTCLKTGLATLYPFNVTHNIQVIGNIFDNPELLEAK